jgi:hypothetical protein
MHSASKDVPLLRWILVGAVAPMVFVGIDDALLARLYRGEEWLIATLIVFVVQVGAFGVLCGRFIDWPPMRWLIYGWCWLVVDLQLVTTAALLPGLSFNSDLLFNAMFAAQLALVTIWGVLGTSNWLWRLPLAIVLGALAALPLVDEDDYTYAAQTVALAGLCCLLRWRRFRLMRVPISSDAVLAAYERWKLAGSPSAEYAAVLPESVKEMRSVQFGIRHVLVWTTSLAIALGIAKAMDLLNIDTAKSLMGNDWMTFSCSGLVAAIVLIVAMWAALGAGPAWVRWPLLIAFAVAGGIVADVLEEFSHFYFGGSLGFWTYYLEEDHIIIVRYALAASLLFATLLIFRTLGYRLEQAPREKRPASTA